MGADTRCSQLESIRTSEAVEAVSTVYFCKCFGEGKARLMPRQYLTFNFYFCLILVSFYPLITIWGATTQQIRPVSVGCILAGLQPLTSLLSK